MEAQSNGFRDFTTGQYQQHARHGIGFSLSGVVYECLKFPPASVWEGIADESRFGESMIRFVAGCIADRVQESEFRDLLSNKEDPIPLQMVVDIGTYLIGEYTNRPTQRSTDLSAGPSNGGATSTVGSPSGVSTLTVFPSNEPSPS